MRIHLFKSEVSDIIYHVNIANLSQPIFLMSSVVQTKRGRMIVLLAELFNINVKDMADAVEIKAI